VFPKQPSQPTSTEMQFASSQASVISVDETKAAIIKEIQAALKCNLPGCDKPCSIESTGQVYDFCSKDHAIAYQKLQQQQKQPQQIPQQPLLPSTEPQIPDSMLM